MALLLSLSGIDDVAPGVWKAHLEPQQVRSLGQSPPDVGAVSVLAILTPVKQVDANTIQFDPAAVRVLAVGGTASTIIIQSSNGTADVAPAQPVTQATASDDTLSSDDAFVRALRDAPQDVRELGKGFILEVRRHFAGRLEASQSGRFIETPDNFWTVKVQPRDRSLAITVRSRPNQLPPARALDIKPDRPGYSRFKVERLDQIPAAVEVLRSVGRR